MCASWVCARILFILRWTSDKALGKLIGVVNSGNVPLKIAIRARIKWRPKKWRWSKAMDLTRTSDALHCYCCCCRRCCRCLFCCHFLSVAHFFCSYKFPIDAFRPFMLHAVCKYAWLWYVSLSANLWLQWLLRITPQNLFHILFSPLISLPFISRHRDAVKECKWLRKWAGDWENHLNKLQHII